MKKIYLFVLLLLIIPFVVNADTNPKVLTLDAKESGKTIVYNGTMEDGAHAVMCKLLDSNSKEIDMLSSAVEDDKFSGTFNIEENGTYKVSCANYEAGETKVVTVSFSNGVNSKNVKTGDNITFFIVTAVASLVTIILLFILKRKKA